MKSLSLFPGVVVMMMLLTPSLSAIEYRVVPEVPDAIRQAELVFSGRIVEVTEVTLATSLSFPGGRYIVKIKPLTWWKGQPSDEVTVVWLTGEPSFTKAEVGETYLVYADPAYTSSRFPRVTGQNRTSKLPQTTIIWSPSTTYGPRINQFPVLRRNDGSKDIEVIRVWKDCGCLASDALVSCPGTSLSPVGKFIETVKHDSQTESAKCLSGRLRALTFPDM
jgi:hypothetical protein